jgi:hypothetical protein
VGLTDVLIIVKFASPVVSTVPPDHAGTRRGWKTVVMLPNLVCCVASRRFGVQGLAFDRWLYCGPC